MMKRITVIIDRPEGSNAQAISSAVQKVIDHLKPLGVRVRVTRASSSWRTNEIGVKR